MTTYTAHFRTDADWASEAFDADTPDQALARARRYYGEHAEDLLFDRYDGSSPLSEIAIYDPDGGECAVWQGDDLRVRLAAQDLLDTLNAAIERLGRASRDDEHLAFIDEARAVIAQATGGEP